MKKLLLLLLLWPVLALGQVYNQFGPVSGILKGTTASFQTSAAIATDVIGLFSGTCNSSTFMRGDGSCATPAGGGNVSTSGSPAANQVPIWASATTIQGIACGVGTLLQGAATPLCTATPTLGASGTLGSLAFGNATSGMVTLNTVTGALGSVTASLPANTGTIAELNLAQTFTANQTCGTGCTFGTSGSGVVNANQVNGATVPAGAAAVASNSSNQLIAATTTGSGSTVVLQNTPSLTTPNIGAATGTSLATTSTQTVTESIGATSTDGQILTNTTAAAAGAQQWSPRLRLTGQGWKTNATAASQTVDWIVEDQPVQGAANPTSNLVFSAQINGGGYTAEGTLSSAGNLAVTTLNGNTFTTGTYTLTGTGGKTLTFNNSITLAGTDSTTMTFPSASATITQTIASGTSALGTGAITSGTCATVVTTSASGTATTDVVGWGFNGDPTGVTGYQASTNGMLTIVAYPSANNVNFKVCNNTASSVTPGAVTLNWRITR